MREGDPSTEPAWADVSGLFREFLLILTGAAVGSPLGFGFGTLVGMVSPEFIRALLQPNPIIDPERAGAAMGMIGGLFVGAAAMVAGRLVGAIRIWAGMRDRERVALSQALEQLSKS